MFRETEPVPSPRRETINELWVRYQAICGLLKRLDQQQASSYRSEQQRIVFESEVIEPLLEQANHLAMKIGEANCETPADLAIKAKVLVDYLEPGPGDAMQALALSLCRSACAMLT